MFLVKYDYETGKYRSFTWKPNFSVRFWALQRAGFWLLIIFLWVRFRDLNFDDCDCLNIVLFLKFHFWFICCILQCKDWSWSSSGKKSSLLQFACSIAVSILVFRNLIFVVFRYSKTSMNEEYSEEIIVQELEVSIIISQQLPLIVLIKNDVISIRALHE